VFVRSAVTALVALISATGLAAAPAVPSAASVPGPVQRVIAAVKRTTATPPAVVRLPWE
jgi:hypothetical protein